MWLQAVINYPSLPQSASRLYSVWEAKPKHWEKNPYWWEMTDQWPRWLTSWGKSQWNGRGVRDGRFQNLIELLLVHWRGNEEKKTYLKGNSSPAQEPFTRSSTCSEAPSKLLPSFESTLLCYMFCAGLTLSDILCNNALVCHNSSEGWKMDLVKCRKYYV